MKLVTRKVARYANHDRKMVSKCREWIFRKRSIACSPTTSMMRIPTLVIKIIGEATVVIVDKIHTRFLNEDQQLISNASTSKKTNQILPLRKQAAPKSLTLSILQTSHVVYSKNVCLSERTTTETLNYFQNQTRYAKTRIISCSVLVYDTYSRISCVIIHSSIRRHYHH